MILRKLASKFETLYCLTLKQRQMKSLRIIFDGGLSFEIEIFLGCLKSRNISSDGCLFGHRTPLLYLFAYLTKAILILEIAQIGFYVLF